MALTPENARILHDMLECDVRYLAEIGLNRTERVALAKCLEAIKPHGSMVLMGNPSGDVSMTQNTYWHILRKELKISGTWNSSFNDTENDWRESLKAMADGLIDVKPLITHRLPLSRCNEAFEMMKSRSEFYNKVMLNMNGDER